MTPRRGHRQGRSGDSIDAALRELCSTRNRRRRAAQVDALPDCPGCGGRMTFPAEWGTAGERAWWINWSCGDCGHEWESVVSNLAAEALDRDLARQEEAIRRTADAIARELMSAEADTFIAALHRDLIDAADFA